MSIADAGQLAKLRALRGVNHGRAHSHALRGPGYDFPDAREVTPRRGPAAYVAAAAESGGEAGPVEDRAAISAEARQLAASDAMAMASDRAVAAAQSLPRWHPMHTATRAYTSALQPSAEQGSQVSPSTEPPRRNVSWVA